ncbi:hypothetical protein BDZ85DRAFT_255636 [Elsinoe ampelina]|uniref:DNA repair protein Rad26 n=1 Tax=Elsinoe ampelina TaxID=302913 RepID=A0A6A6GR53_9PEZI|nr:hypothetical protein BDZ85DRAFT_255636 [Elsinoe ampelina]
MDDIDDEDDLFDNDLEDVPANTLERLEQRAVTLSQRPRAGYTDAHAVPTRNYSYDTRTNQIDSHTLDVDSVPNPPSSDYGFDDEDVIDLDDPTVTFGQHDAPFAVGTKPTAPAGQQSRHKFQIDHDLSGGEDLIQAQQDSADLDLLQSRVVELEQERIRLSKELDDAKVDATTKAGAIANLRSRNERTTKDFEAKLAVLRKEQADERAKLRSEIQTAKNDQEKIKTSNKFLEHDLADERERSKRLRGATNGVARASAAPMTRSVTPKKTNKHGFADGFDDHEIIAISPTKRLEKDRPGTPKAGNKRKRNAVGSPAAVPNGSPMMIESPARAESNEDHLELEAATFSKLAIKDEQIDTIQQVLRHLAPDGRRTVEVLAEHRFPNDDLTIAGLLLESLAAIPMEDSRPASVAIRNICLDLWDRCLLQKYWAPLPVLLQLFASMLETEPSKTQFLLFERLVSLSAKSCVDVAEPRVKSGALVRQKLTAPEHAPNAILIDDKEILSILLTVATSASFNVEQASAFWQRMEFAFTVLMLNKHQPLQQIHLMLQMIMSSILDDSFGARHVDAEVQAKQESDLLDRLSNLLSDVPTQVLDQQANRPEAVQDLRMEVLRTFRAISTTQHGSTAMAQHRVVLGRLVRFLADQTTLLYTTPPLPMPTITHSDSGPTVGFPSSPTLHSKIIATVNLAVRILYQMLHDHEIVINEKLLQVPSADHKFIIGLSRIAFSERQLLEAGLEDVVVDAAHEILDKILTPEEGEAVLGAMDTPNSTRSGRPSLSGVSAPE